MTMAQPIRKKEDLQELKNYYQTIRPNKRNYLLIHLGVNTALRISDLLSLTWNDVYDFKKKSFHSHITLIEHKTKKQNKIPLSPSVKQALMEYKNNFHQVDPYHYLFYGKFPHAPLSRCQAYRILKNASLALQLETPISCHSLRKTFGYYAWQAGVPSVMLMNIYNHSNFQITKRYLGIEQDEKDNVFLNLDL